MSHAHDHSLADHFKISHLHKLGKLGILLLSLHLLFHLVELLLLPSIIALLTSRIHENTQVHDPSYAQSAQVQFREEGWTYLRRPIDLENAKTLRRPIRLVLGKTRNLR